MGYRTYLSRVSKLKHQEFQKLSKSELIEKYREYDDDDYVDRDVLKDNGYLYEFGKYTDFDGVLNKSPYFPNDKELNEMFDNGDTEFCIIDKESLANIIKHYEAKIQDYTAKLHNEWSKAIESEEPMPKKLMQEVTEHIWSQYCDWRRGNVNWGDNEYLTTSWRYEYTIFELVRIYKTFDWSNYYLIYEGH